MRGLIPVMSIERSSWDVSRYYDRLSALILASDWSPGLHPGLSLVSLICYDELVTVPHQTDGPWNNVSEELGLTQNVTNREERSDHKPWSYWSVVCNTVSYWLSNFHEKWINVWFVMITRLFSRPRPSTRVMLFVRAHQNTCYHSVHCDLSGVQWVILIRLRQNTVTTLITTSQ